MEFPRFYQPIDKASMTLFRYVVTNDWVLFSIAIALDGVKVQNYFENKEEKFQNLQSI